MKISQAQDYSGILNTDLYQITMASAYWKSGIHLRDAVFHLTFRKNPFGGGYAVAAGLQQVVEFLENFGFTADDLDYLAGLKTVIGGALLDDGFLEYLANLRFSCNMEAVPEGTAVFPHEPLLRVRGPILEAQLIETPLLNIINFQTLIATKSSRICRAAQGKPIMEFGLRRAQGLDGALSASRAAYVGGCTSTSNVMAGKKYGIPVAGTHAHSWVLAFEREIDAFLAYASAMPDNCVLLVDTYDSIEGIRHAIHTAHWLAERGRKLIGVRLDSGDLDVLSRECRRMLDDAGLTDVKIFASNDLDEYELLLLNERGAEIDAWGVGTRLATAYDQPALGGVYKLSAFEVHKGILQDKIKLSEDMHKSNLPGLLQVRRFYRDHRMVADMIYDERDSPDGASVMISTDNPARKMSASARNEEWEDLLVPVYRAGNLVYHSPDIDAIRSRTLTQMEQIYPGVLRLKRPDRYFTGIEQRMYRRWRSMVRSLRQPKRKKP